MGWLQEPRFLLKMKKTEGDEVVEEEEEEDEDGSAARCCRKPHRSPCVRSSPSSRSSRESLPVLAVHVLQSEGLSWWSRACSQRTSTCHADPVDLDASHITGDTMDHCIGGL